MLWCEVCIKNKNCIIEMKKFKVNCFKPKTCSHDKCDQNEIVVDSDNFGQGDDSKSNTNSSQVFSKEFGTLETRCEGCKQMTY